MPKHLYLRSCAPPHPWMNLEAEDVGKRLSQPIMELFAEKCAPARKNLLKAVEICKILSLLRVGGVL